MAYDVSIVRRPGDAFFDLQAFEPGGGFLQSLALPAPTRPNSALSTDSACLYWVGERHWLLKVPPEVEAIWIGRCDGPVNAHGSLTWVSDAYFGFELDGPEVLAILAQATPLDLRTAAFPVGSASFTEVFGQTGLLHRTRETGFLLYVERSHADFIETWLQAARTGAVPADARLRA